MRASFFAVTFMVITLLSCNKQGVTLEPAMNSNNPMVTALDSAVHMAYLKYQTKLNTVGVSIGIYRNGISNFYGYGETSIGSGKAPDKNTFFEIGSITKTFTSIVAINMLREKGESIESPIRPYLPNKIPTLARDGIEVNFKHLMTHTSGLSYFPDNFGTGYYFGNIGGEFEKYDREKLYTWLINAPLRHKPFITWEYSNGGMGLLGTILELNYGKSYDAVLKEKLLTPLGLNDTKILMDETDKTRWAKGYSNGKEAPYWASLNAMNGAGVIKSTASDLMKYGLANLNPPANRIGEAIEKSHDISFLPFTEAAGSIKINGRLGWFQLIHNKLPGESFIWHNGGTGGFNSDMSINERKDSILVLLFNSDKGTEEREDFKLELLKLISQ